MHCRTAADNAAHFREAAHKLHENLYMEDHLEYSETLEQVEGKKAQGLVTLIGLASFSFAKSQGVVLKTISNLKRIKNNKDVKNVATNYGLSGIGSKRVSQLDRG